MDLRTIARRLGFAEGTSFLLLLGVAMPLKYLAGMPQFVSAGGMVHGLLFIGFCGLLLIQREALGLSVKQMIGGWAAAVLPFGPFIYDARVLSGDGDA